MSNQALNAAATAANNTADKAKASAAKPGKASAKPGNENDDEHEEIAADGTVKVYILDYDGKPADESPYTRFSLARKAVKSLIDDGKTVSMRTARAKVSKQVSVTLA